MPTNDSRPVCLSARGVTKIFGLGQQKTLAVDHVDLDLHEGEVVSIVGRIGQRQDHAGEDPAGVDQRNRR